MTKAQPIARKRAGGSRNSDRNAMRAVAPTPKMAEAAQANRGGLECSSYSWQVRRRIYAFCVFESQEESSLLGCRGDARLPGTIRKNFFLQMLTSAFWAR